MKIFLYTEEINSGNVKAYALAEDGTVLKTWISSNHSYGISDLQRRPALENYEKHCPDGYTLVGGDGLPFSADDSLLFEKAKERNMQKIINQPIGDYVNHSSYKMMRLRMLITGTNAPTDDELSRGLTRLLEHLEKYPLTPE